MGKFEDLPNKINDLETEWDGHSGMEVEDFITRLIEETLGTEVVNMSYDLESSTLKLEKKNGEILSAEVSVVTPTYSYGIFIHGITINDDFENIKTEANKSIIILYNPNKKIKVGIAMYAISTTTVITDRIGPFLVKILYGNKSNTYLVNNLKYELCQIDPSTGNITGFLVEPSELAWIDITDLFSNSLNNKKISATIVNSPETTYELNLNITTEVIKLLYNNNIVLSNKLAIFSLEGGTAGSYHLNGFNNGKAIDDTEGGNLTYTNLVSGLNLLVIRAVHNTLSDIVTDYIYVDLIYTLDCKTTVVAVNGVSNGINNNDTSTIYDILVYSPDKESIYLTTYLESEQPDIINPNPTEIIKHELIDASMYNENNIYQSNYIKYIEVDTNNSIKYLLVKIQNSLFYNFYTESSGRVFANKYKTMLISEVISEYTYYKDAIPVYNFDLINGYLNNILVTDEYASESIPATVISDLDPSDGWKDLSGRVYFTATAKEQPILKLPINILFEDLFTIELGFKTYNSSDSKTPILTIGDFLLLPTELAWNTLDDAIYKARNSQFLEDVETHLMITVLKLYKISKSDIYYPNYLDSFLTGFDNSIDQQYLNLVRIYVNGVIDREINLEDGEILNLKNVLLLINPKNSDIDFYLLRIYNNKALDFNLVLRNYISFLKTRDLKDLFYNKNDILGSNGEISFVKSNALYNTLVYVFPKGAKFPNRAWGGADNEDPPLESALKNKAVTLFVNYVDPTINKLYGGRLTNGLVKGLGSSAMRYLIWNVTYGLNKIKSPEGEKVKSEFTSYSNLDLESNTFVPEPSTVKGYYVMPPYEGLQDTTAYLITKLVGKVNFASSMQSHKIGCCKLYDDAYKKNIGTLPSGGRKAVHEEPFLYFYWETELDDVNNIELLDLIDNDNSIHFMGFQTWGSGKGDDATSGYDEDKTPEYLMLEGGENTEPTVNFRVPWLALLRGTGTLGTADYKLGSTPTISYEESLLKPWEKLLIEDESIVYNVRGAWDIDYGCEEMESESGLTYFQFAESVHESLKKFREFYDFIYKHDYTAKLSSNSDTSSWDVKYKYIVTSSSSSINPTSHKSGDIYRYDEVNKKWVCAGLSYTSGSWERLNIYDISGTEIYQGILAAIEGVKLKFKTGILNYIDVNDVAFHQAFIKFVSGTDNRAKNTYYQITGLIYADGEPNGKGDYKIRMILDDMDTCLLTDNNGLLTKPYNLLETSYRSKDRDYWGDAHNIFFYMFDLQFEENIKSILDKIINTAFNSSKDVNDNKNHFNKLFFNVQETFPAISYNHTAKIYYENALLILDSGAINVYKNNEVEPIELSHGSALECEKLFMKKRLLFLATYSKNALPIDLATGDTSGLGTLICLRIELEPYQDCYPIITYDRSISYLVENKEQQFDALKYLAEVDNSYTAIFDPKSTAINLGIMGTSLYKKLNILGLKLSEFKAPFNNLTLLHIDNDDMDEYPELFPEDYPELSIASFTSSCPILEELVLRNMTLPKLLDLSGYLKLKTLDISNTTAENIIFPKSGHLLSAILPSTLKNLEIYNNPGLSLITFLGLDNLTTVYIEGSKLGDFDLNLFCEDLVLATSLESITLKDVNLFITEEALRKLIYTKHSLITGEIHIVTESGGEELKDISFETKQLLVKTFGNIENGLSPIKIYYTSSPILDFTYVEEVYVFYQAEETGTIIRENPFNISVDSGNDVLIKENGYLDITYSMIGVNPDVATIDSLTGDITLKKESSSTATVTIVMKVKNGSGSITKQSKVYFKWQAPNIGDFAYADGTFMSSYTNNKTMIGLVYAKEESAEDSGTVYIIGKEYFYDEGLYSGYSSKGQSGSEYLELKDLYYVNLYVTGTLKVSDYLRVEGIQTILTLDDIKVGSYTNNNTQLFYGKDDTKVYIDHVNGKILLSLYSKGNCGKYINKDTYNNYSITSLDNLKSLCIEVNKLSTNLNTKDTMTCILYPYYYAAYLYEPKVLETETLNELYRKNNWYVPSIGEMSRIIYYRGYSAKGNEFVSGDLIREDISTTILSVPSDVLKIPIFSLAKKNAGSNLPTEWVNICGSGDNAGPNNIVTSLYIDKNYNNYSYQREALGSSGASYTNKWMYGDYNPNDNYWNQNLRKNGWRLTKHLGVPFVKFNYKKYAKQ